MPEFDLTRDLVVEEPVVVDAPSPAPAAPTSSWECPSCGTLVVSPPHVECQVCGTKPDGSH